MGDASKGDGRSDRKDSVRRRGGGLHALGVETDRVTAPMRRRRGLVDAGLFAEWPSIVGETLADQCLPLRVARGQEGVGGTLHIRVAGPLALELQHLEPQVVERINAWFGYRAIAALRFHQGPIEKPVPARKRAAQPRPAPSPEDIAALEQALSGIDDPELRRALDRLGKAVVARK